MVIRKEMIIDTICTNCGHIGKMKIIIESVDETINKENADKLGIEYLN